jgi:hypothetical protein
LDADAGAGSVRLTCCDAFRDAAGSDAETGLLWAAATKVAEPLRARALEELRADLGVEMRETAALFEGDLPDSLPLLRAAHPLHGSNNVAQVVRLMAAHEERHQHQLRAILKEL